MQTDAQLAKQRQYVDGFSNHQTPRLEVPHTLSKNPCSRQIGHLHSHWLHKVKTVWLGHADAPSADGDGAAATKSGSPTVTLVFPIDLPQLSDWHRVWALRTRDMHPKMQTHICKFEMKCKAVVKSWAENLKTYPVRVIEDFPPNILVSNYLKTLKI